MNIYNKIIDNIIRTDDNWFDYNYKPSNNISFILKVYFSMLQQGKIYKSRILFFYDQINNKLISNCREEFEYLFNKIQNYYYILVRFVNMCKYKKAKIIVNMDLQLNEIKETDKQVLSILHCGKKYLFKSYELIKHINMCLTNSPSFFASPMQIKNPYNGIPFNKSTLYNIYFYIKFNTCMQIELFHKYFMNHFNILLFEIEHEPIIREYAIKNYLNNSTLEILNDHLLNMLSEYNYYCPRENIIEIDVEFPKQKLITIMKPYLKLYLYSLYSMNIGKQRYYQKLLYKKLLLFNRYNNRFGTRIIRTEKIIPEKIGDPPKIIFHHEFSEAHIKYCSVGTDKFMTNHLNSSFLELYSNSNNNTLLHNNIINSNNTINNTNTINNNRLNNTIINENNESIIMLSVVNNLNEVERLLENLVLSNHDNLENNINQYSHENTNDINDNESYNTHDLHDEDNTDDTDDTDELDNGLDNADDTDDTDEVNDEDDVYDADSVS